MQNTNVENMLYTLYHILQKIVQKCVISTSLMRPELKEGVSMFRIRLHASFSARDTMS